MGKRCLWSICLCGAVAPAHAASIESIYIGGQGLATPSADALPVLPNAVFAIAGGTVNVRLDLKNDGLVDPGVYVLPVFVANIGTDPWESASISIEQDDDGLGEGVSFSFAPSAVPAFFTSELDPLGRDLTFSNGPVGPGFSLSVALIFDANDNGGAPEETFEANVVITVPEPGVATALAMIGVAAASYRFRNQVGSPDSTTAT